MKLDNNAHSVFLMHYHLVLVVKYRRKVFDDHISDRAKEIFEYISPKYNITLQEWNYDKDHVHILFKAHPNTEISKFINDIRENMNNRLSVLIRHYTGLAGGTTETAFYDHE